MHSLIHPGPSHPPNLRLVRVLVQTAIQVLPPLKQHRVAYQLEPWCELQAAILEHRLQLVLRDVACVLDFVGVCFVINIRLNNEYVVD